MIVFRDHKRENKRKEMFHRCYTSLIFDSSSTSWELRNSVLPMLFQSGNMKDVSTSTSASQGFFLLNGLQFKHVNCTSSLHSGAEFFATHAFLAWRCERRTFDFYQYFHNSKMLFFFYWLAFNSNMSIYISIFMEMTIFLMKDHIAHETFLGNARQ